MLGFMIAKYKEKWDRCSFQHTGATIYNTCGYRLQQWSLSGFRLIHKSQVGHFVKVLWGFAKKKNSHQ